MLICNYVGPFSKNTQRVRVTEAWTKCSLLVGVLECGWTTPPTLPTHRGVAPRGKKTHPIPVRVRGAGRCSSVLSVAEGVGRWRKQRVLVSCRQGELLDEVQQLLEAAIRDWAERWLSWW